MKILSLVAIAVSSVLALPLTAGSPGPLTVPLSFRPQEGATSVSVTIPAEAREVPIQVVVEDDRRRADPLVIGEGTDDDDDVFTIVAAGDPVEFARTAVQVVSRKWRVDSDPEAKRTLRIRIADLHVEESNKAVGSTYVATVDLRYALLSGDTVLIESTTSGTALRYGRKRSAANCAEVLSDALKEGLASVFSNEDLQDAWISGDAKGMAAEPPADVEIRLRQLDELLAKGLITREEYDAKRAEILKEL
jgi:hypothetical protein